MDQRCHLGNYHSRILATWSDIAMESIRGLAGAFLAGLLALLVWLWFVPRLLLKVFLGVLSLGLTLVFLVFLVEVFWVSPRNVAYRYVAPLPLDDAGPCGEQLVNPLALANHHNNEEEAHLSKDGAGLECMLQFHVVPSVASSKWHQTDKPIGPIGFYMAFLEFQESGRLAETGLDGTILQRSQLELLGEHLSKQKNNFVLVFIHGWRHDARIGDDNVANARVYAAYAASALDYRCKTTGKYCDYTVTAVFVGWRGARVDEPAIKAFADRYLGFLGTKISGSFSAVVGGFPAILTLFDRKPISERIAPSVVAALQRVDQLIKLRNAREARADRLIVIGHSLGGNMLATGLNAAMLEELRNHQRGERLVSPLGNLIVLLNPAAEAWKWTSLQHEMRLRVHFPTDADHADEQAKQDIDYYPPDQRPIYISITSAFSWPSADLTQLEQRSLPNGRDDSIDEIKAMARYDYATHDAFPLFKGNFQPLAETLDRLALWFPDSKEAEKEFFPDKSICPQAAFLEMLCVRGVAGVLRAGAALARNIPFANADSDETLTIGHLNPMRPPYGGYEDSNWQSPLPFGATGELVVNNAFGSTLYEYAGSAYRSECAIVDHWLWKARHNPSLKPFEGWDSGFSHVRAGGKVVPDLDTPNVTPIRPRPSKGHLEIQFRQYLLKSGTAAIIGANDPMWNLRAYDTTIAFHDGYVTYPLICALNQLAMDDVASEPKP
jgi:hypothetical protein